MDCKYNPTGASAPVSSSLVNSSAYNRADKCHRKVAFVVYIAVHTRLLTAIYTIQIGISRVNLSNSLNGNPTLSRLTEVAEILGVEVSELFKPTSTGKTVSGYLEYDGRIVKVESLDVIKRCIADVEATADNSDE